MASEPDSLVLVHLREIRATLAQHSARFDRIDERFAQVDERFNRVDERFAQIDLRFARVDERFAQMGLRFAHMDKRFADMYERFDRLEGRFDDLHAVVSHTFALSTAPFAKSQELDQLRRFSEGEQQRMKERVDALERRVAKVEKKLQS